MHRRSQETNRAKVVSAVTIITEHVKMPRRQHAGRRAAIVLGINGAAVEGDVVAVAYSHVAYAVAHIRIIHIEGHAREGHVARVVDPHAGVL